MILLNSKKNITFLEVLVNRDGESNNVAPLYVDGAVTFFNELPLPTEVKDIQKVYHFIEKHYEKNNKIIFYMGKK